MSVRGALVAATLLVAMAQPAGAAPAEDELAAREAAAEVRSARLALHQGLGLATLASMVVTGGLGLATAHNVLPPGSEYVHMGAAALTTGLYLGTAGLALTAPPPSFALPPATGWDASEVHRSLAWLHGAGMVATVALGVSTFYSGGNETLWHGLAAGTTFGLLGVSAGVITLGW